MLTPNRIQAPNVARLYMDAADAYEDMPAFATRLKKGKWKPVSFRTLQKRGERIAAGLIERGLGPGDRVGLFADNRLEWILADYAIQFSGAVDVPRGSDVTRDELAYIVKHAEIGIVIVENRSVWKKVREATKDWEKPPRFIQMDENPPEEEGLTLAMLEKEGEALLANDPDLVKNRIKEIEPEDLFTLIYTSGTTGTPKGVMLTHSNMVSQVERIPLDLTWRDRILSLLPIWHIFERVFEMITISSGACTYYSNPRRLADDLLDVEPSLMGSAPRLWESLHERILKRVRLSHPVRRGLFAIARWLSIRYHRSLDVWKNRHLQTGPTIPWKRIPSKWTHGLIWLLVLPWYGFFNAAVLERIRQVAGGSLRATVSGGGALPGEIDAFFNQLGIQVLEGYGLTETSPVLAVRTLERRVIGTVGPLVPGTELKICHPESGDVLYPAKDRGDKGRMEVGEVVVRGPQVMKGYYRNEEATEKVLSTDGWFRTGDLGCVTWNDCLKIMGRCKETIVLSSGENLEPGPIEMRLRQLPWIDQCMVVGQDERHLGLLVVAQEDGFRLEPLEGDKGKDDIAAREKVLLKAVQREISAENGFKSYERIRALRILPEPFVMGEEITNLYKLRRHVIMERHAKAVASLFENHGN